MRVLTILAVLATIGCGDVKKELRRLQTERDSQASAIVALDARIDALESAVLSNIIAITGLQTAVTALQADLASNETWDVAQQAQIDALELQLSTLQTTVNSQVLALATLQGYTHIYGFKNPCGDGPGFDEILLETSDGFVAYFEQGSRRFLTVLSNGNYMTTDGQNCQFSIVNGQYVGL